MDGSVDIYDAVMYRFSVIGVTDTQPEMFIVLKSTLLTLNAHSTQKHALDTRGM